MKNILIAGLLVLLGIVAFLALDYFTPDEQSINNFAQCVENGNPVMESYPRQCRAGDKLFVEQVDNQQTIGMANPASVKCVNDGGSLQIETDETGGQYGMCTFADGSQCEEWAYFRGDCLSGNVQKENTFSQGESLQIAGNWIQENAPTYVYDGSDLQLKEAKILTCDSCYEFTFSFVSSHAGYGDRDDQILAQVITNHEIVVNVENGEVINAITDGQFDEINEEQI